MVAPLGAAALSHASSHANKRPSDLFPGKIAAGSVPGYGFLLRTSCEKKPMRSFIHHHISTIGHANLQGFREAAASPSPCPWSPWCPLLFIFAAR